MIHRRATHADIQAIVELAAESVAQDPLPVVVDPQAMADTARQLVGQPAHFAWVTEADGAVVAAVVACVQRSFWFRGSQASVLLFFSRAPGAGVPLLREFARWVRSRPTIKVAVFELEPDVDPRTERLLQRLGFARKSNNLSYVKGIA